MHSDLSTHASSQALCLPQRSVSTTPEAKTLCEARGTEIREHDGRPSLQVFLGGSSLTFRKTANQAMAKAMIVGVFSDYPLMMATRVY